MLCFRYNITLKIGALITYLQIVDTIPAHTTVANATSKTVNLNTIL